MKLLVFLPKGFTAMQAVPFLDIFGWAKRDFGVDITVETSAFTPKTCGAFGRVVRVDKPFTAIVPDEYAALALPGGLEEHGYYEDASSPLLLSLIRGFESAGKPIAAVSEAALVLAQSGILQKRRATTYHGHGGMYQRRLKEYGVRLVNDDIVEDSGVITSRSTKTAPGVAFRLLEMLASKPLADATRRELGFPDDVTLHWREPE